MPVVTIRTGVMAADGAEEIITEYLCDVPDCPNTAEHVMGWAREMGRGYALCAEHAKRHSDRTGSLRRR
jgi:hypothetical protein